MWAATQLLSEEDKQTRGRAARLLVSTVEGLVQLHSWNAALAVFCGIQMSVVTRLGDFNVRCFVSYRFVSCC